MRTKYGRPCLPLFGFHLVNISLEDAAEDVIMMAKAGSGDRINFVNAHCVNVAANDGNYLDALNRSEVLYADGKGMALAAGLAGFHFTDNVNGTDLFPLVCEKAAKERLSLAMVGAKPGVAERCARNMKIRFPGLQIHYVHHGYIEQEQERRIIEDINASGADILYVAMGVPKQELFIDRWNHVLNVGVKLGVGALFDFYSGEMPRAPGWMRKIGMEWFYRLMHEPIRLFNRYIIGNFVFIGRAIFRRLKGREGLRKQSLR